MKHTATITVTYDSEGDGGKGTVAFEADYGELDKSNPNRAQIAVRDLMHFSDVLFADAPLEERNA